MNITTETKKASVRPKGVVRVTISEKGQTKFIEHNDTTELRIKAGNIKKDDRRKFIKVVRKVIRTAQQYHCEKIAIDIDEFQKFTASSGHDLGSLIAQNFIMAGYEFRSFKKEPKNGWRDVEEVYITNVSQKTIREGVLEGSLVGEMVNECRTISNTPGGDMTPQLLLSHARRLAKGTNAKVSSLGRREMERLKMGSILGVSKGSPEEPKFIIMEYLGGKKGERPVVLVGKGVTFDTGGINLKPSNAILGMHLDMSGGAAVLASVALAAKLKIKKNVIALVPSVENAISGSSLRPGDVLTSMSGKTIEVVDTDAEGRLVLADALTYAERYTPKSVVTVATLTGAALVALGDRASALMTRDEKLQHRLMEVAEETGDYLWPLPLWEEYEEDLKGNNIADVANLSTRNARYGGSIMGGIFLQQFAKKYPFAHIDMAPRMTTIPSDNLSSGAAGEPVRLLTQFIKQS